VRLILCLNAGSSSMKAAAYAARDDELALVCRVLVEDIGGDRGRVTVRGSDGGIESDDERPIADHEAAWRSVHDATIGIGSIGVVAHRIVHGGPTITDHCVVDERVRRALDAAVPFAPLHLPPALAVLDAVTAEHPDRPQVACLDTAFHRTMPPEATCVPLPTDDPRFVGVRRYGFHGLNYEHVVAQVGADGLGRAVVAHLGNGASLCAIVAGRSIDTTMGMTPMGGIVMGTRPGDLDPGVVLFLARVLGDLDAVELVLDHRAGLQALSGGITHDVRSLLAARDGGDHTVTEALAIFTRSAAKGIGALATVTGGLDTVVFTGGIGEHAAPVRAEIVDRLEHLGVAVDPRRNDGSGTGPVEVISPPGARVAVLVVPADEEIVMAGHAHRLTN
jgi:acetate kinase